jgi:hypothetical protein
MGINQCSACFQNRLWNAVHSGDHAKLVLIKEQQTSGQLFQPQLASFVELALRHSLQTLLYTGQLERRVTLDSGLQVDTHKTSGPLYWAVVDRGAACLPPGSFTGELVVPPSHYQVVRYILLCLLKPVKTCNPRLPDGVPLLHILLTVGPHYERADGPVDLFHLYLSRHSGQVDLQCPWSKQTSLEVAKQRGLQFQADQLLKLGCGHPDGPGTPTDRPNPWIPEEPENPEQGMAGMLALEAALGRFRDDEEEFRRELAENVLDYQREMDTSVVGQAINSVKEWLKARLDVDRKKEGPQYEYRVRMSGSVSEDTKILPMDELDLILQVRMDVRLEVTDKYCNNDLISGQGDPPVQHELTKIGKNPFPYLARVVLCGDYPGLGCKGEELKPESFCRHMEGIISEAVVKEQLPKGLRVPEGKSLVLSCSQLLERTKSGLMLNLEYRDGERWQELSVDLVSNLVISSNDREQIFQVMPEIDEQKKKYLEDHALFSRADGIIVKNDKWRLSFSSGERKVVALHKELYQVLKYLNKQADAHIAIPNYFLKEIYCSYITSPYGSSRPAGEKLSVALCRLIKYAEISPISTPFLCTVLGSSVEKECRRLFGKVQDHLGGVVASLKLQGSEAEALPDYLWTSSPPQLFRIH